MGGELACSCIGASGSWGCDKTVGSVFIREPEETPCREVVLVRIPGRARRDWVVSVVCASQAG